MKLNPLPRLKRLWNDPKKRPWVIGGAGAAATLGYFTMRPPGPGPEQAAENAAADAAAPPATGLAPGEVGAFGSDGMYGTYVSSPPGIDYDPTFAEMDYGPILDAMATQGEALESAVATQIKAERQARKTAVGAVKKENKQQQRQIERQRKTNRQQRKQIAKLRRRARKGPPPGKKKGRR